MKRKEKYKIIAVMVVVVEDKELVDVVGTR